MRTFKFRFWSKKFNQWIKPYYNVPLYYLDENGCFVSSILAGDADPIIQQFTGLLDKNGKEIYEGDIVKAKYYQDTKEIIASVEFLDCSWLAKYNLTCFKGGIEIIGNIFENQELINEIKN